jgi:archaemetzincin
LNALVRGMKWTTILTPLLVTALHSGVAVQVTPPTSAQSAAAIGPTDNLPETLRRALEPGADVQPLPAPGPADWLANHHETGQTFDQFVRSQPNRPDHRRRKLYLQPIGAFNQADAPDLDELLRFASAFFAISTGALPPLDLKSERIANRRNPFTGQLQLLTTDLLESLRRRLPDDAFALVGITMTDLYPDPTWNFVFGQASPPDRVGVYSFARYTERSAAQASNLLLRRSLRVLAHETCHMFGIEHCIWYRCLMNGSNHLAESDARPLHLCPVDLRKLQWSVGFDIAERYRRLLEVETKAGLSDETAWLKRRLRFIETR